MYENQTLVLIRFYGSPEGFIASLNNPGTKITNFVLKAQYQFQVRDHPYTWQVSSQNFNTDSWYQITITQQIMQACNFVECFSAHHMHPIQSNSRFFILQDPFTDLANVMACCIIMYKGITYPNNNQILFYNTKLPETIININIQEKQQSNITVDYSEYQYIAKLGNQFEFDQYDPFFYNDGLLFNGSQKIQINQINLDNQLTIEFRIQRSNIFTSNVILLNYTIQTTQVFVFLNVSQITYKFMDKQASFQLLDEPIIHFSIGIIQYYAYALQQIYFMQYSNSDTIQILQQNISAMWSGSNGFGSLKIGSIQSKFIIQIQDQFNSGEYFNLFHYRQYFGFFYDDQSVMKENCQIYLNDKCIICKTGYVLKHNHDCALQCDSTLYLTKYISTHNQCLTYCHPKCAQCQLSNPSVCLTCYGVRLTPPECSCPSGYFEDNVSPNCRSKDIYNIEYYPDVTIQTGTIIIECDGANDFQNFNIPFGYTYKVAPMVLFSLIGSEIQYNDKDYILNHYITDNLKDSYNINFFCNKHHVYVMQWISNVGYNIPIQFNAGGIQSPTLMQVPFMTLQQYGETLNPIFYSNGWNYLSGSSQYGIRQTMIGSTTISFSSNFNYFFYLSYYTLFKTYQISDQSLDTILDNQPKSIQAFVVQRGFSIQTANKFTYLPYKRNSTYFSLKSRYQNPMQIYDWLVIMASQRCLNKTGPCDFYQSYDSNCNQQLDFCLYVKPEPNTFLNSSYYYEQCHSTCKTCIGNAINQCTTCYVEQNMNLQNGKCVYNCDSNCLTCSDSLNTTCLSCVLYANLNIDQCVCIDGYYFEGSQCQKCSHQCLTCQSYDKCLTCSNPLERNGDTCDCGDGQYYDENNVCYVCQQKCKTCNNGIICTSCVDTLQIIGVGDCLCPSGFYFDGVKNCQPCSTNCLSCNDLTSCFECISDMILINGECACNSKYFTDSNQSCQQCNMQCRTCDGPLANQCLSCNDDRNLSDTQCVCKPGYYENVNQSECSGNYLTKLDCPINCQECLSQYVCTKCRVNQQLSNGTCVCQDGYFEQNNQCYSCNSPQGKYILQCNHIDCQDKIWNPSEQCDDGNDINRDGCTQCQIDKNYSCLNKLNQKSICFQCPFQCSECGYNKQQLLCKQCHDGYYLSNNMCFKCSTNCKTCIQFSTCISCPILNTYPNQLQRCQECDYGYYPFPQVVNSNQISCQPLCGDGILSETEQCDDGNAQSQDGCNQQCQVEESFVCITAQNPSNCFYSQNPQFYISNTFKLNDKQYLIQILSDQRIKYNLIKIQVKLVSQDNYNYTYDVGYTQKKQFYQYLTINITMNFTQSFKQEIFEIDIDGDIYNSYNQTVRSSKFFKYFEDVYILSEIQKQTSELGSQIGSILFYINLSLTLLQLFISGVSSISLMIKTQNYIYYMKFMNIKFPPNLEILFNQFTDFNLIYFINLPQLIFKNLNIDFISNYFYKSAEGDYNNQQINADFIANITPITISIFQAYILIQSTKKITQVISERITTQNVDQIIYASTYFKYLKFIQFCLLKVIIEFKQNGFQELFLISQYQIYFAVFISIKTFQYDQIYDYFLIALTLSSTLYLFNFVFKDTKNQSLISLSSLINQMLYITSIVYLNNFQLIQILFIASQQIVQVTFLFCQQQFEIARLVEEISLLLLFLSSIFYVYSPIDVDYIHVGFIQIGAIIITYVVNMIIQVQQLYATVIKYYYRVVDPQKIKQIK